jgi:phosphoribosyl 1,2-cyclic phosphate phosphodiesterase
MALNQRSRYHARLAEPIKTSHTRRNMTTENETLTVTCLGTGTSHGVPMIACDCDVCTSDDPHDKRTRPSITVSFNDSDSRDRTILIDTAPELRLQTIASNIRRVDAVLYTHHHADHVTGLDDLRRFNWLQRSEMPVYASPDTADALQKMFTYAFERDPDYPSAAPTLTMNIIDETPFEIFGMKITPIPLLHGKLPVLGFRFARFAYCTDCSHIPDASLDLLRDLDILILDALRHTPHPTHFTLEQAVEMATRIKARKTLFTHIAHELPHRETNANLPQTMALAYDTQTIQLPR